ncbi:MAG: hypothetical protein ABSC92_02820 [Rhizomicrobium sp.]|jgi:hypothetical protein
MDAVVEWAIHHAHQEWSVLTGAPLLVLAVFGLALLLSTFFVGKLHESRHAAHDGTVEQKDAHIANLKERVEDYKSKLSGASPDQAAQQLRVLSAELADTRSELATLTKWYNYETFERHLSANQKTILCEALRAIPIEARLFIYIGCVIEREPQQYAIEILEAFKAEGFCSAQYLPQQMQSNSMDERGVLIVVHDEKNPPPHAIAVSDALRVAGIDSKFDTFVTPNEPRTCAVAISHKPAPGSEAV